MSQHGKRPNVACTLAAADYTDRLTWIDDLNAEGLRNYRREGGRMELADAPLAETQLREFVSCEQQCYSLLDFTIRRQADAVIAEITTPEGTAELADALFGTHTAIRRT